MAQEQLSLTQAQLDEITRKHERDMAHVAAIDVADWLADNIHSTEESEGLRIQGIPVVRVWRDGRSIYLQLQDGQLFDLWPSPRNAKDADPRTVAEFDAKRLGHDLSGWHNTYSSIGSIAQCEKCLEVLTESLDKTMTGNAILHARCLG